MMEDYLMHFRDVPIIVFFGSTSVKLAAEFHGLSFIWSEADMCREHIHYRFREECQRFASTFKDMEDPSKQLLPTAHLN